ncbi:MAG: type I-C CRISPR-associated protein Cas8c/Csd1 [Bacteroidota bacterium]
MNWMQRLCETYECCKSMIGSGIEEDQVPLLPICHTTQKAHIEVVIDGEGHFKRAAVVPKEGARTIIPCTEQSGGRTSGEAPHPLCDKLQYVAKDFAASGGRRKSYFASFRGQLTEWGDSEFRHPKAMSVLRYVSRGNVVRDLIRHGVLFTGNGRKRRAPAKKKTGSELTILDVVASQEEAFIRWVVEIPGERESKVWMDRTLWERWIRYYTSTKAVRNLCQVTGEESFIADQHPAKLRTDGDKAKLVSSNDLSGFTFRGRFLTADEACSIGFEATQKAHSALRWLLGRQGYRHGDQAVVAWAVSGQEIPNPLADTLDVLGPETPPVDSPEPVSTAQEFALRLKRRIAGYGRELGNSSGIMVLALDSATPGRMAMTFQRELFSSDFLERVEKWHSSCAWLHKYRYKQIQGERERRTKWVCTPFVGAPSPSDIAEAAYGKRVDEKMRRTTVERILPCIIDGRGLPKDLVASAVHRASHREGLEDLEWEKALSIACALYRKLHEKENHDMSLDPNRRTRDYLYGRLLAVADSLEQWALSSAGEERQTNAARLMHRFAEHPFSTWRTLELSLSPYKARLGCKAGKHLRLITEIISQFDPADFSSDRKLSGEFLLGYHCQREALWGRSGEPSDK